MITLKGRKLILLGANALLAAGMVAAIALAALPLGTARVSDGAGRAAPPPLKEEGQHLAPAGEFAVIYRDNLRRPLYDVAATAPAQTAVAAAPLPVQLLGTILEPGFTYALLRWPNGGTKSVAVGETADGVAVVSVGETSATVRFSGREFTLTVEGRTAAAAPAAGRPPTSRLPGRPFTPPPAARGLYPAPAGSPPESPPIENPIYPAYTPRPTAPVPATKEATSP